MTSPRVVQLEVLGMPTPKARPRVVRNQVTGKVHTYTPMTTTQSLLAMSCRNVVAPPRPNRVPRPGTVEECHMRAWFSTATMPSPAVKSFLMR